MNKVQHRKITVGKLRPGDLFEVTFEYFNPHSDPKSDFRTIRYLLLSFSPDTGKIDVLYFPKADSQPEVLRLDVYDFMSSSYDNVEIRLISRVKNPALL